MAWSSGQRYLAEFLGTFALLLFGGGAAVFTITGGILEPLSRAVLISFAIGVTILGAAYALGDVSGGHFNPAVTIAMWVGRRMPARDVLPYIVAQVVGGIVGIGVVAAIVAGSAPANTAAQGGALASQCYSASNAPASCGFSWGSVFLLEAALTFVFALVILLVTRPESPTKNLAPVAIGLTLMVTNLVAIPVDGASINPARSFAPALLSAGWSSGNWAIGQDWLFWIAPIVGGILAGLVAMAFRGASEEKSPPPAAT